MPTGPTSCLSPRHSHLNWDSLIQSPPTKVSRVGLGFTWDPYSAEPQNPSFPGRSTLTGLFPPPDSPDPCLPGTNLRCSMNYTSWLMGAQYGWKFLRTAYERSRWGACVSSAPSYESMVDSATLKVWAAGVRSMAGHIHEASWCPAPRRDDGFCLSQGTGWDEG